MNPSDLERELASLRPVRPSPSLAWRVERGLARPAPWPVWRLVAAAATFAAGVLLVAGVWPEAPAPTPRPTQAAAEPSLPVLAVYRHALDQSPEELEQLLDRRALEDSVAVGETPVTVPTSLHHLRD